MNTGIVETTVSFLRKEASLTYYRQKTNMREVVQLLARMGYGNFLCSPTSYMLTTLFI